MLLKEQFNGLQAGRHTEMATFITISDHDARSNDNDVEYYTKQWIWQYPKRLEKKIRKKKRKGKEKTKIKKKI